jgi:restriction system protein
MIDEVAAELWKAPRPSVGQDIVAEASSEEPAEQDMEQLANEAIKDRIAALDPYEMQDLVAGLLRAMGYKTRVSPPGSDRGKDIVASPDGLGLEDPSIVVEVKHRRNQRIAAPDIRSFLGGRHPRDRGLYVSTGGFSRDAYYEAERANIPVTLMDFEDLVETIQDHYSAFDEETRQLLPLKAIYWPISK